MSLTTIKTAGGRIGFSAASGVIGTLVVGIYLAVFQSGLSSYIGADLQGAKWLAPIVLAVYGGGILAAIAGICLGRIPPKVAVYVGFFLVLGLLPITFTQGAIGPVAKSYVVGMFSLSFLSIAAGCGDARRLAQFSASVTCVASIACLLDLCFFDGFSNTAGRAAALYINPNVAALALLLGAVGSTWAVSYRWRPAYLVLVAGAVVATLSRSAILLGVLVLISCVPAFKADWQAKTRQMRTGAKHVAWILALVIALFVTAAFNNKGFLVAARGGAVGAETALRWFEAATSLHRATHQSDVTSAALQPPAAPTPVAQTKALDIKQPVSGTKANTRREPPRKQKPALARTPVVAAPSVPPVKVAARVIAETEEMNSAAARGLLAERAWIQFKSGPATGIGLERAFSLVPHNSFLLLADAFGYYGWIIVPALVAMMLVIGGWRRALPAATLVIGASLVSHDLLLAMPLVAGLVCIIASLAAATHSPQRVANAVVPYVTFASVTSVIAIVCAVACISQMHRPKSYEGDLSAIKISAYGGDAYYVVLPPALPPGLVRYSAEGTAGLTGTVFTEAGHTLSPTRRSIDDVGSGVRGRYGFENGWLYFSSSDGSQPRANGRQYHVMAPIVIHPLFVLYTLLMFIWAGCWLVPARVRLLRAPGFAGLPFEFSGQ
ncbi:hypothetical protein LMG24076_00021 [Trinickia soli]|uniref:Uncharacterized protein n=1 Tax=Trinickia soli TaxID=380675 RepID=A0A2N7WCQ0_9BURK|nr:hypothetical protein C0Z19_05225 [Trinickia soli]CAB3637901.1 hypothetical protein LMG24076_00021 [Trinickia soli]